MAILIVLATLPSPLAAQVVASTQRISTATDGSQGDSMSYEAVISTDGRFVAFQSAASNLVPDDTNGITDVFVRDRATGITERISVATDGTQAEGPDALGAHAGLSISPDGRYVTFSSEATNLVPGDTNGIRDVFIRDRALGVTERVSIARDGSEPAGDPWDWSGNSAVSADGRYVTFQSSAENMWPGGFISGAVVFVRDRHTGSTELISERGEGPERGLGPSISGDGRFVAFYSYEPFVSADTNRTADVYVRDREMSTMHRVSIASDGQQAEGFSGSPSISEDGRFVAFQSDAPNLVAGDGNGIEDIFVHDRQTGETERVSVTTAGAESHSDGFQHNRSPSISSDGRYVTFASDAHDLVADDTNARNDVFLHDRETGRTERVSVAWNGDQSNHHSHAVSPAVSNEGRVIAFSSAGSNLVPGDTNGDHDVFVRSWEEGSVPPLVQVTPESGNMGTTFTSEGSGFSLQSSASVHLRGPDGSEFPPGTVATSEAGEFSYEIDSTGFTPGSYTHWAVDDATGTRTQEVVFEVFAITPAPELLDPPGDTPNWVPFVHANALVACTYHNGCWQDYHDYPAIDVLMDQGTPIHAAGPGVVVAVHDDCVDGDPTDQDDPAFRCPGYGLSDGVGGYGNVVIIEHPDGRRSYYGHLGQPESGESKVFVQTGRVVARGDLIALSGATGYGWSARCSCKTPVAHLHYEERVPGLPPLYQHGVDARDPGMMFTIHGERLITYPSELVPSAKDWRDVTAFMHTIRNDGFTS